MKVVENPAFTVTVAGVIATGTYTVKVHVLMAALASLTEIVTLPPVPAARNVPVAALSVPPPLTFE